MKHWIKLLSSMLVAFVVSMVVSYALLRSLTLDWNGQFVVVTLVELVCIQTWALFNLWDVNKS